MPQTANDSGQKNQSTNSWLTQLSVRFRAWLKNNAEAHANAKPHSCCSAPPPGAGESPAKKEN